MTADEIVDYNWQNSQSNLTKTNTPSLCPACIQSWICIDIGNKAVICGQVHNYPKNMLGKEIKTSPIQGYCSSGGRMYVSTENVMYALGIPHRNFAGDPQLLVGSHEM